MGNGYHEQINHKGTFLPLLCSKPSIKDVVFPKWKIDNPPGSLSHHHHDTLSPKISCMGHVKRNNKIVGFPVSYKLTNVSTKNNCDINSAGFFKLKKLFSGKNLTVSPATVTSSAATTTTTTCRTRQVVIHGTTKPKSENSGSINIETMDPPLPVIKKEPKQGDDTIWQRRSRGVALRGLKLQLDRHQEQLLFDI